MRTSKQILSNKQLSIVEFGVDGIHGFYHDPITNRSWQFVFSWGGGWEHLSVSSPNKTPSWDLMCKLKEIFWRDTEACVEYHPKKKDYINFHSHCLHIWRPLNEKLPIPPRVFVGIKTGREHE